MYLHGITVSASEKVLLQGRERMVAGAGGLMRTADIKEILDGIGTIVLRTGNENLLH